MPELRAQPRLLVVHDDGAIVRDVEATMPGWWVGVVDHGDLAVADAGYFDAVLVDLEREPADGWFVLARLAPHCDVVAVGTLRQAARAMRLGAIAVIGSIAALGDALDASLVA
jgi:DNA-binding NtrC family response regulator